MDSFSFQGSYIAELSPDPFGGDKKRQPWFRVINKHPAGLVVRVYDFILDANTASDIAHQLGIDWRAGRGEGATP